MKQRHTVIALSFLTWTGRCPGWSVATAGRGGSRPRSAPKLPRSVASHQADPPLGCQQAVHRACQTPLVGEVSGSPTRTVSEHCYFRRLREHEPGEGSPTPLDRPPAPCTRLAYFGLFEHQVSDRSPVRPSLDLVRFALRRCREHLHSHNREQSIARLRPTSRVGANRAPRCFRFMDRLAASFPCDDSSGMFVPAPFELAGLVVLLLDVRRSLRGYSHHGLERRLVRPHPVEHHRLVRRGVGFAPCLVCDDTGARPQPGPRHAERSIERTRERSPMAYTRSADRPPHRVVADSVKQGPGLSVQVCRELPGRPRLRAVSLLAQLPRPSEVMSQIAPQIAPLRDAPVLRRRPIHRIDPVRGAPPPDAAGYFPLACQTFPSYGLRSHRRNGSSSAVLSLRPESAGNMRKLSDPTPRTGSWPHRAGRTPK